MSRAVPTLCFVLASLFVVAACSDDGDGDGESFDPAAAADRALDDADAEPNLDVTGDGTTTSSSSSTTTTTTTTTTIPGIVVNENLLGIDECFNRIEDLAAGRAREITTLVDCADPHSFQIFSNLQYPADGTAVYPGDDIMEDFALASCYQRFEAWADSVYETSVLEIRAFTPDREQFEDQSYRRILCYVERTDGELLVGTARSSGL